MRLRLVAAIAACALTAVGITAIRPRREVKAHEVSFRGEVVCAHCLLHQEKDCRPVVRVQQAGRVETISLSDNAVFRDFYRSQGCGRKPVPVIAVGVMHGEGGAPLLAVTRLEIVH